MPTTPGTGGSATRTVDEQFLDLICSDEDWLRAEFDAIIAAEWPDPPVSLPPHQAGGGKPERRRSSRWRPAARAHPEQTEPLGGQAWRRQRSPPT